MAMTYWEARIKFENKMANFCGDGLCITLNYTQGITMIIWMQIGRIFLSSRSCSYFRPEILTHEPYKLEIYKRSGRFMQKTKEIRVIRKISFFLPKISINVISHTCLCYDKKERKRLYLTALIVLTKRLTRTTRIRNNFMISNFDWNELGVLRTLTKTAKLYCHYFNVGS